MKYILYRNSMPVAIFDSWKKAMAEKRLQLSLGASDDSLAILTEEQSLE